MEPTLKIPSNFIHSIETYMQSCLPEEGCGLLAGVDNLILDWYPITNTLHDPVLYQMDAQEQLTAFLEIENRGMQLLAIVHSHPRGQSYPSITDISEAYYPEVVYIIYAPKDRSWVISGYSINEGKLKNVKIEEIE